MIYLIIGVKSSKQTIRQISKDKKFWRKLKIFNSDVMNIDDLMKLSKTLIQEWPEVILHLCTQLEIHYEESIKNEIEKCDEKDYERYKMTLTKQEIIDQVNQSEEFQKLINNYETEFNNISRGELKLNLKTIKNFYNGIFNALENLKDPSKNNSIENSKEKCNEMVKKESEDLQNKIEIEKKFYRFWVNIIRRSHKLIRAIKKFPTFNEDYCSNYELYINWRDKIILINTFFW